MYFLDLVRFELRNATLRAFAFWTARRFRGKHDLLVQVGCGPYGRDGWVNIDCFPRETVNCLYDVRKDLPFDDESVKGIFCEHVFEHLDYSQSSPTFLAECYRCLAPGGVLRIIVPDAGKYLHAYTAGGFAAFVPMRQLTDRRDPWLRQTYGTPMELVNAVFHQGTEHHVGYDAETLEYVLRQAGFTRVTQQSFGRSHDPIMCLDREERASESLYMEAVR
jgi:predicted SAM-dependent methyltransferase